MIEAVRDGDADMAIVSAATLSEWVPDLLALDLPFLFSDAGKARAVLDGPAGR
jgi:TRAP-type C4-dicarboxylate transport system substrate-binding protein